MPARCPSSACGGLRRPSTSPCSSSAPGRYVTSGKVFEYAASALPIVSVHDPGNAASDVLRDYPLWFPVADLEPESIAAAVEAAADAARTRQPDPAGGVRTVRRSALPGTSSCSPACESLAASISPAPVGPHHAVTTSEVGA